MEKLLPWFTLKSISGVGNHLFKRLIKRFGSPELVFQAPQDKLFAVEGMTRPVASAVLNHKIPDYAKKELDLVAQKGYKIITMLDDAYPSLLLRIPDPPPFLYVSGHLDNSINSIAVVGSRNATDYGISTTKRLCADLAFRKITVVSGMARGIDTAAHNGALIGKGKTIAVLGSGLDKIYPYENKKLFKSISENGAVISEFALGDRPEAYHFPMRNRIISGISLGTVVVEATQKSGSLITARLAAEQGREVFAVPGNIHSFKSVGPHRLIKQGAKLVEHAQDILEEFFHILNPVSEADSENVNKTDIPLLTAEEALVFEMLGLYPVHIDDLKRKIGMESGKLSSLLLQLELKGIVHQSPGKFFTKEAKDRMV